MPPLLYDVFVVGPLEPGPAAEARRAETLAKKSGRPAAAIAQALARKNLRLGHGIAREVADAIALEMQAIGALTTVTPHTAAGAAVLTPMHGFTAAPSNTKPGIGPPPLPAGPPAAPRFTLTPLGTTTSGTRPPAPPAAPPLRPLATAMPEADSAYEPPSSISSFALPETPVGAPNPFALPGEEAAEAPLELSRSSQVMKKPRNAHHTLAGASAMNTDKIVATNSASGLTLADGTEGGNIERCASHGLLFDRVKARGCRKCLQARRSASQRDTPAGGLRASPVKRAFVGMGFALALGFVPAGYYATKPGIADIQRLRAEQTELSQKAGTEAILRRFDEIDELVSNRHWHVMANTALIWLGASAALLAGFYKVTS